MLEKRLSWLQRAGFAVLAVAGIVAAVNFFEMATRNQEGVWRIFTVPPLVLSAGWAVLTGWIAVKGVLRLRWQYPVIIMAVLAMCYFTVVTCVLVWIVPVSIEDRANMPILGTQIALMGFFMVNTIGLCMVLRGVCRMEFRSREKMLEIECQLAELGEKIDRMGGEKAVTDGD